MSARRVSTEPDAAAARAALEETVAAGGVALFPADGVYGLACDPLRAEAIERIYRLKGRDEGKPAAVMYFSPLSMRELVSSMGSRTREAVGLLLPGPFTLVIDNPDRRYPLACRQDPRRLGVRLIEGPLAGVAQPVFQTSANRSGGPAASSFDELDPGIVDGVELVIDGGTLGGEASTVVDLSGIDRGEGWSVLREGAVSEAEAAARLAPLG